MKYLVYDTDTYIPQVIYDSEIRAMNIVNMSNGQLSYIAVRHNENIPMYKIFSGYIRMLDDENISYEDHYILNKMSIMKPPDTIYRPYNYREELYYISISVPVETLSVFKNHMMYFTEKILQMIKEYKENENDYSSKDINNHS